MPHIIILMDAEIDNMAGNASTGSNLVTLKERYHTLDDALAGLSNPMHDRVHNLLDAISDFLLVEQPAGSLSSTIEGFISACDDFISAL